MKLSFLLILLFELILLVSSIFNVTRASKKMKSPYKSNFYSINSIETNITIPNKSADGLVTEKVTFVISEGIYSNITRKIYTEGLFKNLFSIQSNSK